MRLALVFWASDGLDCTLSKLHAVSVVIVLPNAMSPEKKVRSPCEDVFFTVPRRQVTSILHQLLRRDTEFAACGESPFLDTHDVSLSPGGCYAHSVRW